MHLNAQRPVFVPDEFWREIEKMSKAALMDMAWDYAAQIAGLYGTRHPGRVMEGFRARRDIILTHRSQARAS